MIQQCAVFYRLTSLTQNEAMLKYETFTAYIECFMHLKVNLYLKEHLFHSSTT